MAVDGIDGVLVDRVAMPVFSGLNWAIGSSLTVDAHRVAIFSYANYSTDSD